MANLNNYAGQNGLLKGIGGPAICHLGKNK